MNAQEIAGKFRPASELYADAPDPPAPVFGRYLRRGDLGLTSGAPKAGKTTFTTALIEALASGAGTFLGEPIAHGPVVLVSEERTASLVQRLQHQDVHVVTRDMLTPKPSWPELVQGAVLKSQQVGAVLLVIDTLRWWSDLAGKQSNDDGAVMATMRELAQASAAGVTVLAVVHHRKGGGEAGEAVSGSNAFVGAVDVLLEWERPRGSGSRTARQLVATGRWADTPGMLLADYDPATRVYSVLGHGEDLGGGAALEQPALDLDRQIIEYVAEHAPCSANAIEKNIIGGRKTVLDAIRRLLTEDVLAPAGKGIGPGDRFPQFRTSSEPPHTASGSEVPGLRPGEPREPLAGCEGDASAELLTGDEFVDALLDDPDLGAIEVDSVDDESFWGAP